MRVGLSKGLGLVHDDKWKILVLQAEALYGTLHLMGTMALSP